MKRCLCCYKQLHAGEIDYHSHCIKKVFGSLIAPELPYTRKDINELAQIVVANRTTVTGVQSKLSIDLEHDSVGNPQRLTIVGVIGRYILKPQTERFERLPEIEDLSMHLAEIAKIPVVPHALIRFADGELNYITRRIDRTNDGKKLPMEDMCQLSGKLTEQKYQGSYESITRIIEQYSSIPQLDKINYWQQVVFSWIIGNADMHLKNFSLYSPQINRYVLSPTYDQVSTKIIMPEDTEEMALYLNGFKKKLLVYDFREAMLSTGISEIVTNRILSDFSKFRDKWFACIDASFISDDQKLSYKALIDNRLETLAKE
ncbi:HipA domain-containing protein [Prevotella veroralis]|uniref:HipA-like C-terminal domain protein n=1 Tax=Prevotella veroralis F0319 TaxID=649761 RepID=C9MMM8_9BACT|nr:HipA domain-containing protein [Prevotella veroralis]EEX19239.1 HipA-like C-terminal domain protein [Prevotella veroralis F0319]QUB41045.1 HipA domain-containing protein [Prevotella veroralis]